jgi:hypothetical protein
MPNTVKCAKVNVTLRPQRSHATSALKFLVIHPMTLPEGQPHDVQVAALYGLWPRLIHLNRQSERYSIRQRIPHWLWDKSDKPLWSGRLQTERLPFGLELRFASFLSPVPTVGASTVMESFQMFQMASTCPMGIETKKAHCLK